MSARGPDESATPSSPPLAAERAPAPTVWPALVALGITTLGGGLVADLSVWTSQVKLSFFLFGALALIVGLAGWVRALRDEGRQEHE